MGASAPARDLADSSGAAVLQPCTCPQTHHRHSDPRTLLTHTRTHTHSALAESAPRLRKGSRSTNALSVEAKAAAMNASRSAGQLSHEDKAVSGPVRLDEGMGMSVVIVGGSGCV
jgi:hypothetical protein